MIRNLTTKLTVDQDVTCKVTLSLIVMLGAALRFYDIGAESYWQDEIYEVYKAQGRLGPIVDVVQSGAPPVYHILAHLWVTAFGTSELAARSLSTVAGIISIAVMYVVARELFGKRVALISAFLIAISEFQIHYSQEFRFYSLFLLMTSLSFLSYIRALRSKKLGYFFLYVVASGLMYYTHTFGIFVLLAQNLCFLMQRRRYREVRIHWFLSQTLILMSIGPHFLLHFVSKITAGSYGPYGPLGWDPAHPLWYPLHNALWYVFPLRHERTWVNVIVVLLVGMAFFVTATLIFAMSKGRQKWLATVRGLIESVKELSSKNDELCLVCLWFLCPIVMPFILSRLIGHMYEARYTISASPAFYLLVAVGITTIRRVVPELVSILALLIVVVPGLHHYYVTDVKEQWAEVATYIEENGRKGDVIVFAPDHEGWEHRSFDWYYQGDRPTCGIDAHFSNDQNRISDALAKCTSGKDRFWLIVRGPRPVVEQFKEYFLNGEAKGQAVSLIEEYQFTRVSLYLFTNENHR
ncbi:MAG: hypothetical protein GTO24_07675 [candidate division Zixibacteria bacterium]|nr:hypothetical protein [candidate division Zixibacteria bacterium]